MADVDADIGQLSPAQQEALQQYLAVTNQDTNHAIPLLNRSQWNVQIAIAKFFDGEDFDAIAQSMAVDESIPQLAARHETLQQSFASQANSRASRRDQTDAAPRIVPQPAVTRGTHWLLGLVLAPLNWGWQATSIILRTVLYTLSFLPQPIRPTMLTNRLSNALRGSSGRRMLMPRDTAARFKRDFDEEYGSNDLPFYESGIAQAHDLAKKEVKFLLVVLLSPEHDDTASFVRDTLLAPQVSSYIKDPSNDIILWGGNVLDSEAFQVASEYKCTKYPFSALVCLTPKEGGSTRMGIVKRLAGPMPPSTYLSELQGAMEKYRTDMANVRAERNAQQRTRNLRNQQDSAYEKSLAIDRQRAQQKKQMVADALKAERLMQEQAEATAICSMMRNQWITWRASQLIPEPLVGDKDAVRVAIKMPEETGMGRITRRFAKDAPMEELYAFIECYGVSSSGMDEAQDPIKPQDYEHEYMFRVASTLPRIVYEPSMTETIGSKIGRSSNLIVETDLDGTDEE